MDLSVPGEEARASQVYVIESLGDGERDLLLTDVFYEEGDIHSYSPAAGVPASRDRIIAGPFDTPPLPHVLAALQYVEESRPDIASMIE